MKKLLFICMTIVFTQVNAQTPPNKICYDYDVSGNRIGQKPAWLDVNSPPPPNQIYNPDCNCNVPEETFTNRFKGKVIVVKTIEELPYIDVLTNVLWILHSSGVPSGIRNGTATLY